LLFGSKCDQGLARCLRWICSFSRSASCSSAFWRSLLVDTCFKISSRVCFTGPTRRSGVLDRSSGNAGTETDKLAHRAIILWNAYGGRANFSSCLPRCYHTLFCPLADALSRTSVLCVILTPG
jgi:hypothetical protein